ncbi:hypothetical protein HYALB_00000328 [Hymenoscyphus albidus]|uniref:F-box domain-containing protein n=1 Tax=Hymenoscyphus albidus TaxID=595503 RepID=A0A9N9LVC3_9HELO|nr:hypothetical protein HYALB_00000328 [Hymenoscyphus albidus]
MSSSMFSALPPEIICQIFEAADDFSVVAALAQTARVFYHTWRENPTSICQVVGPRIILDFAGAQKLLDVQEEADAVNQSEDSRENEPKSITRAKRLIFHARCASAAYVTWAESSEPCLKPEAAARFESWFYCVWTLGFMAKTPLLQGKASAVLDEYGQLEISQLEEFTSWAQWYHENEYGSLGLDFCDKVWTAGCELVSLKRWLDWQSL